MTAPHARRLITAEELADLLAVSLTTVRRSTRRGEYPFAVNLGTPQRPRWRYDTQRLDRWIDSRRHGS